ncbi:P27 family phage terminase small subunit [Undibacterium curvum]|uniref:P27 family phage terminase small subunit n=1 Tax=Undibacterium curvum TaxID=2762294 RepID=UPI001E4F83B3|nr:P27 family phage terminase small subunit [Undibacterium curvum]
MSDDYSFAASPPAVGNAARTIINSPEPPPGMDFDGDEKKIYEYLCCVLRDAGLEHMTAGMPLAVIVRTYRQWLYALRECEEKGRTQVAKSGWAQAAPWAEDEKRLKMELGQWLPKACLTIPSLARVKKETGAVSGQDDLFQDLVSHGLSSPARKPPH